MTKRKYEQSRDHGPIDPLFKREEFALKLRKEKKNELLTFLREQLVFQNIRINPQMKFLLLGELSIEVTGALREIKIGFVTLEDTRYCKKDKPTYRLYVRVDVRFKEAMSIVRHHWHRDQGLLVRKAA